jgi:hypothetical protein
MLIAAPAANAAGMPRRLPFTCATSPTTMPSGPATGSSRSTTAAMASRNPRIARVVAKRGDASMGANGSWSLAGSLEDPAIITRRHRGLQVVIGPRLPSWPSGPDAEGAMDLTMTRIELDTFLDEERVLRLATLDDDGWPVVAPVWFVWHESAFWVWNLERAKRTPRLRARTRCAFTVDGGIEYAELRGTSGRLDHRFVPDGEVPEAVRVAFSRKYLGTDEPLPHADHHAWIRFEPITLATWDFRKLPSERWSPDGGSR